MKWYINAMALAFGSDYQDLAPLPGGNLGSSQQSKVLHMKSRGKGPAMFMSMMEQLMNFHGLMPNNVKFKFGEQDTAADMERAQLGLMRAKMRAEMIKSGEITPEIARQMALDSGDLDEALLAAMGEQNVTPDIVVPSTSRE
jgi:hypothetical protein